MGRLQQSLGTRSGTILGRYELVRRIGTGGMAEVYEAVHRGLKKTVALKVLLPETASNPELRARFLREGEAASRIQHPHVVDVTDVAEDDGVAYMVMEFLEGQTLNHLLADSPGNRVSLARTLDVLLPIAAALEEAHQQGVVHRDLKPENVFIARSSNGRAVPKILDFGVSKLTNGAIPSTTAVSAVLGTPHYMSPEQARGDSQVDGRADQYSFALMVYECVTGTLPFVSDNVVALIHEVSRGVGMPPSRLAPDLPPDLDIILLKALGGQAAERYPSMLALAEKLLPFASERAREGFAALLHKEPAKPSSLLPPPSEITGTFGMIPRGATPVRMLTPASARHPTPTVAERPVAKANEEQATLPPPDDAAEPTRRSPLLWLAPIALLLLLGAGVWFWGQSNQVSPGLAASTEPVHVAATGEPEAPPAVPEPERMHVAIVAQPSTATLELDGEAAGTGTLERWLPIDGVSHRIVARAEGYEEQTVVFQDEPPPLRLVLEPVARVAPPVTAPADRRRPRDVPPPTGGSSRPDPMDVDIRTTR